MRYCQILIEDHPAWAVIEEEQVILLASDPIADFASGKAPTRTDHSLPLDEVLSQGRILPPVRPTKALCIGINYMKHAEEMNEAVNHDPIMFMKPASALNGHGGIILLPAISQNVHYEGELAVVIGKRCRHVSAEDASAYIFGYTCANDVTARDLQRLDGQWTRGKSFDTFMPVGPWIETAPGDIYDLTVQTRVNGKLRQDGNTGQMRHDPYQLLAFISQVMTLEPGDLILTGTPEGVGRIVAGDEVEVKISGIGVLKNMVAAERL